LAFRPTSDADEIIYTDETGPLEKTSASLRLGGFALNLVRGLLACRISRIRVIQPNICDLT